jgi:hypothetical protein
MASTEFFPIKVPPGFFRNGTNYESAGRWYDGSLVRWHDGRIRPIGGWRRVLAGGATLTGAARAIIGWRSNKGFRQCAIGTNTHLYAGTGGAYADITPNTLVPGRRDGIEGPGFGVGPYGAESYGTQRVDNVIALDASSWSFDLWGENLVCVLDSDGRIFQWSPITGGDAAVIANAPIDCLGVLVTDEQHLIALGPAGNRRKVQWCSQFDNTLWTVADTNTAGSRTLQTTGNIVTAGRVGAVPLILTGEDAHVLDYLGPPLVYGNRRVGQGCGGISRHCLVTDESAGYWMGLGGFFTYDGTVKPLPCEVQDYVSARRQTPGSTRFSARRFSRA